MSDSKEAPTLPTIVDEAADSPTWLPLLGVVLFCAVAASVAWQQLRGAAPQAGSEAPAEAAAK